MIKIMPFRHVNALTDIKNNMIYLSSYVKKEDIEDVMKDEFAHLICRSPNHDNKWKEVCESLYNGVPEHNDDLDEEFSKLNMGFGSNVGNVTGISNLLTDLHLLQAYRKFSSRIIGTDGGWEVTGDNKIVLKPTPKGSFPVVIRYIPSIDDLTLPIYKEVVTKALIAEAKIFVGLVRRKLSIPSSDGGTMNLDGDALVTEGREEKKEAIEYAISLGEPMPFVIR